MRYWGFSLSYSLLQSHRTLLRLRRERHQRERRLAILAKRPARIHPHFPDKARSPPR